MGDCMLNIIKRNKSYILFISIILITGIILGYIYYNTLDNDIKLNIINTLKNTKEYNFNYIIKDLFIMSLILVLSFFIIGIPLGIFSILYGAFSIGFILNAFIITYNINGVLYILLYLIITKIITLLLKILFLKKIINIGRFIIGKLIYKKEYYLKDRIIINFKKALYIILFTLINNIIVLLISPLIFSKIALLLY